MATGIRKLHSRACRTHGGGRCNCGAGWEASVYLAREGRKVRKTFRLEAEAKSWRADAMTAAKRGTLRDERRDTRTLADALSEFVAGMQAGTVRPKGRGAYKPNTVRSYERVVRGYFDGSALGRIKVPDVRRRDVQAFADELLASGKAPGTVSNILNPLQTFYRRAIDRDELAYNPAARIDLPTEVDPRPKRIASADEAAQLLEALPAADRPLWATAFYAGLRRGELQVLRRGDVDLGASLIHVEHGWDQEEGEIAPKSAASRRTVPLLAILRDYLDEHLIGDERPTDALIFGRGDSRPFAPMGIGKRAAKAWTAANTRECELAEDEGRKPEILEPITLHECRHTFVSLLIDAGANAKAIQTFVGHSKIQTTFDTYGHLMPGSHDEVRERLDAYLSRSHGGYGEPADSSAADHPGARQTRSPRHHSALPSAE